MEGGVQIMILALEHSNTRHTGLNTRVDDGCFWSSEVIFTAM